MEIIYKNLEKFQNNHQKFHQNVIGFMRSVYVIFDTPALQSYNLFLVSIIFAVT